LDIDTYNYNFTELPIGSLILDVGEDKELEFRDIPEENISTSIKKRRKDVEEELVGLHTVSEVISENMQIGEYILNKQIIENLQSKENTELAENIELEEVKIDRKDVYTGVSLKTYVPTKIFTSLDFDLNYKVLAQRLAYKKLLGTSPEIDYEDVHIFSPNYLSQTVPTEGILTLVGSTPNKLDSKALYYQSGGTALPEEDKIKVAEGATEVAAAVTEVAKMESEKRDLARKKSDRILQKNIQESFTSFKSLQKQGFSSGVVQEAAVVHNRKVESSVVQKYVKEFGLEGKLKDTGRKGYDLKDIEGVFSKEQYGKITEEIQQSTIGGLLRKEGSAEVAAKAASKREDLILKVGDISKTFANADLDFRRRDSEILGKTVDYLKKDPKLNAGIALRKAIEKQTTDERGEDIPVTDKEIKETGERILRDYGLAETKSAQPSVKSLPPHNRIATKEVEVDKTLATKDKTSTEDKGTDKSLATPKGDVSKAPALAANLEQRVLMLEDILARWQRDV